MSDKKLHDIAEAAKAINDELPPVEEIYKELADGYSRSWYNILENIGLNGDIEPTENEDGSWSYSWSGAVSSGPTTITFLSYPKWCRWQWLCHLYDKFIRKEEPGLSLYVNEINITDDNGIEYICSTEKEEK